MTYFFLFFVLHLRKEEISTDYVGGEGIVCVFVFSSYKLMSSTATVDKINVQ